MYSFSGLGRYWSAPEMVANFIVFLNLLGALLLGLLVGYERTYRGRAAGMRTYGLVCMASAALTVIGGYPALWFGGQSVLVAGADPTRVIQGIVTGIGFLGAGVIMKEGFNISGLTTAASIWSSSVIGIMVGVGFYPAAVTLALLSLACMMWVARLEAWLPSRPAVAILVRFKKDSVPSEETLHRFALEHGYEVAGGSFSISASAGQQEWRFVAVALNKQSHRPLADLANHLAANQAIESFQLSHARN